MSTSIILVTLCLDHLSVGIHCYGYVLSVSRVLRQLLSQQQNVNVGLLVLLQLDSRGRSLDAGHYIT
jgi:hypothetical protein